MDEVDLVRKAGEKSCFLRGCVSTTDNSNLLLPEEEAVGLLSSGLLWEVLPSGDDLLWAAKPNDGISKDGSVSSIVDFCFVLCCADINDDSS